MSARRCGTEFPGGTILPLEKEWDMVDGVDVVDVVDVVDAVDIVDTTFGSVSWEEEWDVVDIAFGSFLGRKNGY
jgi:hypothetical protein